MNLKDWTIKAQNGEKKRENSREDKESIKKGHLMFIPFEKESEPCLLGDHLPNGDPTISL